MNVFEQRVDVGIIGGGLAGLAAAVMLARAGRSVAVLEKAGHLGGRAYSYQAGDYTFNLGPHALYRGGEGEKLLRELGIDFSGKLVAGQIGKALRGGQAHGLPAGAGSLLKTTLLDWRGKLAFGKLLAGIGKLDSGPLQGVTVSDWLERNVGQPVVREAVLALIRVATYGDAPNLQSMGSALDQLKLALSGSVWYLDGGWQTLVDGLRAAAERAGALIACGSGAAGVERDGAGWAARLGDGRALSAETILIAAGPAQVAALLGGQSPAAERWAAEALPVRLATLDLGLRRLPQPANFALGIDRPLYFSVHSDYARLAPAGGAMLHAGRYLRPGAPHDAHAAEAELEAMIDLVQPGWRAEIEQRRFLPNITVANALVTAKGGGTPGRPGPAVPELPGLFVAGDWVGPRGQLADAALASASQAARLILARPANAQGAAERIAHASA